MYLDLYAAPASEPLTIAEARRQLQLGGSAGEPAPTAPTAALASPAAAGSCDAGAWRFGLTFGTADGETDLGDLSSIVTVADKAVNGQILLSELAIGGSAVTARKVYAIAPGESVAKLVGTVSDNTTTTYTVNVASTALGAQAPSVNSTLDPELERLITSVRESGEQATDRAFLTQTWDWVLDAFPADDFLEVPKPPLQSVTSITYKDAAGTTQTMAATDYVVDTPAGPRCRRGRIALAEGVSWPTTYGQAGDVVVRFVAGYGATGASVPSLLRDAMLLELQRLYTKGVDGNPDLVRAIYTKHRSHGTQRGVC